MDFSQIAGHDHIIQQLDFAYTHKRIPSAYLFTGVSGIGKSTLARLFAQKLNCHTNNNCQTCGNCKMFEQNTHPDFLVLKADGKFIKIGQIQNLIEQLSLKPLYAKKRVVLVEDAQKMNMEAANCFLKILEEPPLDTLIILITTDETLLLETTVSRTQIIYFSPLNRKEIKTILEKNYKLSTSETPFILNYSRGKIRADFIEQVGTLYNLREQTLHLLRGLKEGNMVDNFDLLEYVIKQDLIPWLLEFCSGWLHDWLTMELGYHRGIINSDLMEEVQTIPENLSPEILSWCFDLIIETERSITAQAAKLLALEALIIKIKLTFRGNEIT